MSKTNSRLVAEFEPSHVTWVAHSFSSAAFTQGHDFHPESPLLPSTAMPTYSFANTTEFTVCQSLGRIYTHNPPAQVTPVWL